MQALVDALQGQHAHMVAMRKAIDAGDTPTVLACHAQALSDVRAALVHFQRMRSIDVLVTRPSDVQISTVHNAGSQYLVVKTPGHDGSYLLDGTPATEKLPQALLKVAMRERTRGMEQLCRARRLTSVAVACTQ